MLVKPFHGLILFQVLLAILKSSALLATIQLCIAREPACTVSYSIKPELDWSPAMSLALSTPHRKPAEGLALQELCALALILELSIDICL